MHTVAAAWKILEEILQEHAHSVFRALRKGASAKSLERFAARLPASLPRDFAQSLAIHDGLRDSYLGEIRLCNYFALLPLAAISKEWTTLGQLQDEDLFTGGRAAQKSAIRLDAHWRPGWVPFLDADGDKLVIDLDPGPGGKLGQIVRWDNNDGAQRVVAPSYRAWLSTLAERLQAREFTLDEQGGIVIDDDELF